MLFALALALSAPFSLSQSINWSVNFNNTLIWDGRPYMPIGARVNGDTESIQAALSAGIKDLVIELPANGTGWTEAVSLVEAAGARWFLAVSSAAPAALGTIVEPGSYRIETEGALHAKATIPGANEMLGVIADKRDASIRISKNFLTPNGVLDEDIDPGVEMPQVLLLYPVVRDLTMPDFWEGFDEHRDTLLRSFGDHKMGNGFRGVIDPLGPLANFPSPSTMFVPRSMLFRLEFEAFLLEKYGSVTTCIKAWSIGAHDIKSWEHLARLVPLWSVSKGVESLWDPVAEKIYPSDRNRSSVWNDIREVTRSTAQRRFSRLVKSIEQSAGVPVIQTWDGWNGPYDDPASGLAGVSCRLSPRTVSDVIESVCRPASTVLQAGVGQLLVASSIRIPVDAPLDYETALTELKGVGVRAWFFSANDANDLAKIAALSTTLAVDGGDAEWKPSALFYPEGARNPAIPARMFGATWTLPSPAAGNRLDFGSAISGYYYSGKTGDYTVLWAKAEPIQTRLFLGDPRSARVESLDGQNVRIRIRKDSIELEVTQVPLVITGIRDVPIPEIAYQETVLYLAALFGNFGDLVDPGGDQQFLFAQSTQAFKRNPIGGYTALRRQFETLAVRAAPYMWIEAERAQQSSFGDVDSMPGASGGDCLVLNSRMRSDKDFFASYKVRPRANGRYEFWVAAAMPDSAREHLKLVVNEKPIVCKENPTEFYGLGFKWYKFESVELKGETNIRIELSPDALAKVAVDVIVASPGEFHPTGGQMPLGFIAPPVKKS